MALPTPVAITANIEYVASYYTTSGHSSYDQFYFAAAGVDTAPLHAPAGSNGVYTYAAGNSFPQRSHQSSNYWVDVVFNTVPQ